MSETAASRVLAVTTNPSLVIGLTFLDRPWEVSSQPSVEAIPDCDVLVLDDSSTDAGFELLNHADSPRPPVVLIRDEAIDVDTPDRLVLRPYTLDMLAAEIDAVLAGETSDDPDRGEEAEGGLEPDPSTGGLWTAASRPDGTAPTPDPVAAEETGSIEPGSADEPTEDAAAGRWNGEGALDAPEGAVSTAEARVDTDTDRTDDRGLGRIRSWARRLTSGSGTGSDLTEQDSYEPAPIDVEGAEATAEASDVDDNLDDVIEDEFTADPGELTVNLTTDAASTEPEAPAPDPPPDPTAAPTTDSESVKESDTLFGASTRREPRSAPTGTAKDAAAPSAGPIATRQRRRSRLTARRATSPSEPSEAALRERLGQVITATSELERLVDDLPLLRSLPALGRAILDEIVAELQADNAALWQLEDDGYHAVATVGLTAAAARLTVRSDQPLLAEVAATGGGLLIDPIESAQAAVAGIGGAYTSSFMAAAIALGPGRYGIITVGRESPLVSGDLDRLMALASEAAPGVAVAQQLGRLADLVAGPASEASDDADDERYR